MEKKKMKRLMKGLSVVLLIGLLISMGGSSAVYAQTQEVYWTDDSGTRFTNDTLALSADTQQVIHMKADVPAGKTLQAYKFTVTYDATVIDVVKVDNNIFSGVINKNTPGTIVFNGFDVTGIEGQTKVNIIDLTIKGVANDTDGSQITIEVNTFGAGSSNQFLPLSSNIFPLTVMVSGISAENQAYWADESGTRFSADATTLAVDETKTITLMAEIPEGETLRAFHFTLTYDAAKVAVTGTSVPTSSVFTTQINTSTPGIISVNGFHGEEDAPVGVQTVSLLNVDIRSLTVEDSYFGITVNNFGNNEGDEFKPVGNGLNITATSILENEVYWADTSDNRLDPATLTLQPGETQVIRLIAEIPANKTLKAFNFNLTYDPAVIEVTSVVPTTTSTSMDMFDDNNVTINTTTPGTIVFNGFDVNGVVGGDGKAVAMLDVTVKGTTGSTSFAIAPQKFGNNEGDEFLPDPTNLAINVSAVEPTETYFVDAAGNRITAIPLNINGTATVRLVAEIPAGKTLKAYKFIVTYDKTVAGVDYVNDDISPFSPNVTANNDTENGQIITNGFSVTGVTGPATIDIMDITLKGLIAGSSPLNIQVEAFGSSSSDQFEPAPVNAVINVGDICTNPPVAIFTYSAGGLTAVFNTTGSNGTLTFNYGDGSTGTATTHTYAAAGTYTVTLTATNPNCTPATYTKAVTVSECTNPPYATFTYSATNLTVTFYTTGSVGTLSFNYGDGSTGMATTHTYASEGTYTVTLTATNPNCTPSVTKKTVTVVEETESYIINATSDTNGTITPSGQVKVNKGANQTFIFTPKDGFVVENVQIDGESVGSLSDFTFENVTAPHTIHVTFREADETKIWIITATAGSHGTISPSGEVKVTEGANQSFIIQANNGYEVEDVVVDGESVGVRTGYTFTAVNSDHTIHVTFKSVFQHTITATAGANGIISPAGEVEVNEGADQTFTFTPNTGYGVEDVKVDNVSVSVKASYTFTNVTEDHTIHVTFKPVESYTITATAGTNGSISPSGTVTVNKGENQTFTFTPKSGYEVENVKVDNVSKSAAYSYTFTNVTEDHTIHVTFKASPYYTITASAGANGTISPSGTVSVNEGENQTFTFIPNTGYNIVNVEVDGVSVTTASSYTFVNVTANHTIYVTFGTGDYTITATAGENGSISPSGAVKVNKGADQTFTFTANTDYKVTDVKVDGSSIGVPSDNTYTFTNVISNHTIEVTFGPITTQYYTITASAGVGGTISPPGPVEVGAGEDKTFTITPDTASGYVVDTVKVDDAEVALTDGQYYTFVNVAKNHTIHATFKVVYYTITASAGVGGVIEPTGSIEVVSGGDKTFNMEADDNYQIAEVKVDSVSVGIRTSYTFSDVNAHHTIRVTFTPESVTVIRPNPPELVSPCNNTETSLTPDLKTTGFSYPDDTADEDQSDHAWTGFSISTDSTFEDDTQLIFKGRKTETGLTFFTVPEFILKGDVTYYWRARYANDLGVTSEWSDVCTFTTEKVEIVDTVKVEAGEGTILTYLDSVDTGKVAIPSGVNMPMDLAIFTLEIEECDTDEPGQEVEATVLLAEPLPTAADNPVWYQYDQQSARMLDYSDHAVFNDADNDGKYESVTLTFQDGGFGDIDGIVNCSVSVGPSGYGVPKVATVGKASFTFETSTTSLEVKFDASASTGECFVWDFGDGSKNDISCVSTGGLNKVVTHEYEKKGTYTVTLLVMGSDGSESISKSVTVPKATEGDGGGDNCFISTTANGSMSFGSMIALMLMTVIGAAFFRKVQR